jgi:hypothetical protein
MTRHHDLLTRREAAILLGVKPTWLERGNGPPALPIPRRPKYYSREICEQWLAQQKGAAWDSTNAKAQPRGGVDSRSPATRSGGALARQTAERLRSKSADCAPTTNPRHLVAVPEDLQG